MSARNSLNLRRCSRGGGVSPSVRPFCAQGVSHRRPVSRVEESVVKDVFRYNGWMDVMRLKL